MTDEPSPRPTPSEPTAEDRLDSWKQIASYLKRAVTTVQRWEKREGMPVHRHLHDSLGSVYASRAELDEWTRSRKVGTGQESIPSVAGAAAPLQLPEAGPPGVHWRFIWPVVTAALILLVVVSLWVRKAEVFWRSPIANARVQALTDFGGLQQSAAVSRDGRFVTFLSDRAGQVDVWLTQVGSGEFHNLTHGSVGQLVNPSIRNLGFSPDGSLVTFWVRRPSAAGTDIDVWAVPILGGEPRPYLQGVAEFDWSQNGSRLVYHTAGAGDPLFVSTGGVAPENRCIFTAIAGLHSHFPLWAPDAAFVYFVYGTLPDKLDIWRIAADGGLPERITSHNARVSYPVLLDRRTLVYLASETDGSGQWLYSIDIGRRIPHRLTSDLNRYTSLAGSADGRRLVVTVATPKTTLWRMRTDDSGAKQIPLTTNTGFAPRLGLGYLLYASMNGNTASIWKLVGGSSSELWRGTEAKITGGPAVSPDSQSVAFSIRQHGKAFLYAMRADGTDARIVARTLNLQGAPAWSPDGLSIVSAADDHGVPHLFRVPVNGGAAETLIREYSMDPAWSLGGRFLVYSGPDIGTNFSVQAVAADAKARPLPALTLTRGARHLAFLPDGHELAFLRGDMQHKDLWLVDLETGVERKFIDLPPNLNVVDFDISPDGHEVVLERLQEDSSVVLLDLAKP